MNNTNIRAKQRFYNTAVNWGCDMRYFEPTILDFSTQKVKSSFKKRASEIKEKYNYNFRFKRTGFESYPDISRIIFEKVNPKH